MSNRITERDLDDIVFVLNELLETPLAPYGIEAGMPQAGNYHLSFQYGRVSLLQMSIKGGTGCKEIFPSGTKPELYSKIQSLTMGIYLERERAAK